MKNKKIMLTNEEKYSIEELNELFNTNDCSICSHFNNEEECNGDNSLCNGEKNTNGFSFIGIKEII